MTTLDVRSETHDDALARHNARVLAVCQALGGANASIVISVSGLVGAYLLRGSGHETLATLPVSLYVVGTAMGTLPVQALVRRFGRRLAYHLGTVIGACGGLIAMFGTLQASFAIVCLGTLFCGFFAAFVQSYRFAAADTASPAFRPKAMSWVLGGGVASGIIGPQAVVLFNDWFEPILFAGAYMAQAVITLVAALVLILLKVPAPRALSSAPPRPSRPLRVILTQPAFIGAVTCAIVSYAVMSYVMTASPLAMVACGLSMKEAALGIQWHVLAMFGPSFVTGSLIARFGAPRIVLVGLVLLGGCSLIALSGLDVAHFWAALVLLGIGWNFGFLGASALVAQTYTDEERSTVQGANDLLIFGFVAIASLSSGGMFGAYGWAVINMSVFPFLLIALGAAVFLMRRRPV